MILTLCTLWSLFKVQKTASASILFIFISRRNNTTVRCCFVRYCKSRNFRWGLIVVGKQHPRNLRATSERKVCIAYMENPRCELVFPLLGRYPCLLSLFFSRKPIKTLSPLSFFISEDNRVRIPQYVGDSTHSKWRMGNIRNLFPTYNIFRVNEYN